MKRLPLPGLLLVGALPGAALAQPTPPPPLPFATYRYQSYTVLVRGEPPTRVAGAGGTLTLRPDSTYAKRLRLPLGDGPPRVFAQQGRFRTQGDSIFFTFTDAAGPDVQRGTFRYEPRTRRLTIRLAGYPPGNYGEYELADSAAAGPRRPAASRPR